MNMVDIVIPWVDGEDDEWLKKKSKYDINNKLLNEEARYRDFGILKYSLRSIESFLPWVNRIFIITDNQIPSFLNVNHPKIRIIDHRDFIPSEYLPTFNSNTIELNVHRINELADRFILMNDDMIFTQPLDESDFFVESAVVDSAIFSPIFPKEIGIGRIVANNISILNSHFSKRQFVKENFFKVYSLKYGKRLFKNILMAPYKLFSGFYDYHVPIPYFKQTYREVMEEVDYYYRRTCQNKFRTELDINHWLVRYWQLASGKFIPRENSLSRYILLDDIHQLERCLNKKSVKMICINDTNETLHYAESSSKVINLLEKKFPHPSSFERRGIL